MLVLLLSTIWCVGGYSQETSFGPDWNSLFGTSYSGTFSTKANNLSLKGTSNGMTLAVSNGKSTNGYVKKDDFRAYNGYTITISSSTNAKITSITSVKGGKTFSTGIKADVGNVSIKNNSINWTGSSSSVKFTISNTVSFASITVSYEDGSSSSKTPTTTTFGPKVNNQTFTINEGEAFPTHVATMTTAGAVGTIAYASDNAAVNVDQKNGVTSAGTGFGKAKITATFTPTDADTYASSSAYYYIDYKEKTKPATAISFDKSNVTLTTLDYASFTGQTATLKAGETTLSNELTYSKIDAAGVITTLNNDGTLVLSGKPGTATVTATFNGNAEYASSTASYTITVKEVIKDIATLKTKIKSTSSGSADPFSLKLTNAIVTYKSGDKAYIQDETGGIYCTASGFVLLADDKVNGIVEVKAYKDRGQNRINNWKLAADAIIEHDAKFTPEVVTIAQLNADIDKYENMRVKVIGATANAEMANKQTKITQDGETIVLYDKEYDNNWDFKANDILDIEGYPINYSNKTKEILVYRKGDVIVKSSVVKTTVSFDPATTEYNVDNNNAFTAPTATVKDAEGNTVEGAAITYTSSKPSVATVGETDGTVTFVGLGTTVITASYAGDATHMASKNSYTINYVKVKTTMAWSAPTATANLGETSFDAPTLTLKAGDTDILAGKTIKYSSSATDVAEISAEGTVTINAEGTTVITATFEGDDTYAEASAEYTLTVKDPNKMEVTFDFMQPVKYGYGVTSGGPAYGEGEGDVPENATLTEGIVTLKNTTCSGSGTRFYIDGLRTYDSNAHTLYVPAGYRMTSISFNGASNYIIGDATPNSNWTGEARKVIIKYTDRNKYIKSLTVAYKKVELPPLTLNEDDNDIAILENEKTYANVTATRSMIADGGWYTFCVPFDIEDIATTPLKDAEIRKYKSMTGSIMNFEPTTSLKAMHAYLVKPTSNIVNPEFEDVFVVSEGDNVIDGENGYKFVGIYSKYPLALDGTNLFLGADNTFYVPTPEDYTLNALRGYFVVPEGTSASKMGINIDGETTSISALNTADAISGKVYNLNGQYVGNNVKTLQKGIYVVNGKKIIVK